MKKATTFNFRSVCDHKTKSKYSKKSANYTAKSTILSEKQRLYTYDRDVYAKTAALFFFFSNYKPTNNILLSYSIQYILHI